MGAGARVPMEHVDVPLRRCARTPGCTAVVAGAWVPVGGVVHV